MAIRWQYRHALLIISLCDQIKTFLFDVDIPNISLYISVVVAITYGSMKWVKLVEIDWTGRLKTQITDVKETNGWGDLKLLNEKKLNKDIDYILCICLILCICCNWRNVIFGQKQPIQFQLFGLSIACLQLFKFFIWVLKPGVSFCINVAPLFNILAKT